ncbi:MAG: hypothetical protein KDB14_08685 [Planctomycetales bacterium]|nr:hypothetical protein [Planctomycetales bacterium]
MATVTAPSSMLLGPAEKHVRTLAGSRRFRWALLIAQVLIYAVIAYLSLRFEFHAKFQQRPILLVLGLLATAFALHIASLRLILRESDHSAMTRHVLLAGVLFRLILLPSYPIQEVDIYRYLWDGAVVASGHNPYRFSPKQVLESPQADDTTLELQALAELRDREPSCQEVLARIHFGELITVYPPVSQGVFGLASLLVPARASLYRHLLTMKVVLTSFDLGILWLVILILRRVQRHPGWAILYGWSPLVLKEFANSGHLDSIAVFLTTAAILALISGLAAPRAKSQVKWLLSSSIFLGLGVGAKLYPIVLVPVLTLWVWQTVGRRASAGYGAIVLITTAVALAPMILTEPAPTSAIRIPVETNDGMGSGVSIHESSETAGSGLATFLSRWEINDFIFMVVVENLRPDTDDANAETATRNHWFVILPQTFRVTASEQLSTLLQRPVPEATFLTARALTLFLFMVIVSALLVWAMRQNDPQYWLRIAFLTLAWFWALAPTLNPWYWTWVLPLVPFSGRRTWMAVSLLVLAYYLRFWTLYHPADSAVPNLGYRGEDFFHFVIVPVEHLLWLAALSIESLSFRSVSVVTEADSAGAV